MFNSLDVISFLLLTICKNILDYKEAFNSIYTDEGVAFSLNTNQCNCTSSTFRDPYYKHIIKDLRIIENNKLRKILRKGPNYREQQSINFPKAFSEKKTRQLNKFDIKLLQSWKEKVLAKVN